MEQKPQTMLQHAQMIAAYYKVIRVIRSCKTKAQLDAAKRMHALLYSRFPNLDKYHRSILEQIESEQQRYAL